MNHTTHSVITVNSPPVLFTEIFLAVHECIGTSSLTADLQIRKKGRPRLAFWNETIVSIGKVILSYRYTDIFFTSCERGEFHDRNW